MVKESRSRILLSKLISSVKFSYIPSQRSLRDPFQRGNANTIAQSLRTKCLDKSVLCFMKFTFQIILSLWCLQWPNSVIKTFKQTCFLVSASLGICFDTKIVYQIVLIPKIKLTLPRSYIFAAVSLRTYCP